MSIKILKEDALDQLKGRWWLSFFTLFTHLIILRSTSLLSSILSNSEYVYPIAIIEVTIINIAIRIFLTGVLNTGRCKFLLNMTEDYHSARFIDLFSQFKIYHKTFFLPLLMFIVPILWYIPVIAISAILLSIYMVSQPIEFIFNPRYYFTTNQFNTTMIIIIVIISIFFIASIIISLMYSQAFYILADNPNKSIFACLKESRFIMKGNKFKFIWLHLTFTGWYFLCFLIAAIISILLNFVIGGIILAIGFLLLEPYIELTKANFYINAC